jgi:hypothetical protein
MFYGTGRSIVLLAYFRSFCKYLKALIFFSSLILKAKVLVPCKHSKPSLLFASKLGASLIGQHFGSSRKH